MATVWAYCTGTFAPSTGKWESNPKSGWSDNIPFSSLSDLNSNLTSGGFQSKITKLAIIAHGHTPGVVLLDTPPLTAKTINVYENRLQQLVPFFDMKEEAFLIFFSCIAGDKQEGTDLLLGLSKIFKGIKVVGFNQYGFIGSAGTMNTPGNIIAVENEGAKNTGKAITIDDKGNETRRPLILSPWGAFAKWAYNGAIIRLPVNETRSSTTTIPGFHENNLKPKAVHYCANIYCKGHKSAFDRCY